MITKKIAYFFSLILLVAHYGFAMRTTKRQPRSKRTEQKKAHALIKPVTANTTKPIIVCDLINVLFQESYSGFAQKIGYTTLANYTITHWKNPGHRCLDMFEHISTLDNHKPEIVMTINDRAMPQCIIDFYSGKKNSSQTHDTIEQCLQDLEKNRFFSSTKEKNLMKSIIDLIFDTTMVTHITEPIKPMITLIKTLKNQGHKLYICANAPSELYHALEKKYASIFQLFDGAVLSCEHNSVKPQKDLFEKLLTTYEIPAHQCILIDHADNNVATAKALGMKGIVYTKHSHLMQTLKKMGLTF